MHAAQTHIQVRTYIHTYIHTHTYIQAAKAQRLAEIRAKVSGLIGDAIKFCDQGKYSEAESAAKGAIELDPTNEQGWRELAMCRQGLRSSTTKVCTCVCVYVCMYTHIYKTRSHK